MNRETLKHIGEIAAISVVLFVFMYASFTIGQIQAREDIKASYKEELTTCRMVERELGLVNNWLEKLPVKAQRSE